MSCAAAHGLRLLFPPNLELFCTVVMALCITHQPIHLNGRAVWSKPHHPPNNYTPHLLYHRQRFCSTMSQNPKNSTMPPKAGGGGGGDDSCPKMPKLPPHPLTELMGRLQLNYWGAGHPIEPLKGGRSF